MQRDMSSHLDASFSTRGAGQLINEQVVTMQEVRAGDMRPAPHGLPRDGRYTIRPIQSGGGMGCPMAARSGNDMLPGMGAIDIPGIGPVRMGTVAMVAGAAALFYVFVLKPKLGMSSRRRARHSKR